MILNVKELFGIAVNLAVKEEYEKEINYKEAEIEVSFDFGSNDCIDASSLPYFVDVLNIIQSHIVEIKKILKEYGFIIIKLFK